MEKQNMNSGRQPAFELKEVEIRNSKYFSVFGIVMGIISTIICLWLYWYYDTKEVKYLILSFVSLFFVVFFYWQLKDRSIKLRITSEGVWDYKKFYSWAHIEDVKTKTERYGDNMPQYFLVIKFKQSISTKEKKIEILGYDRTTSEIDVFAKSYKKLFDERQNGNSQGWHNPETVPSGIDKHQKEMLNKSDEELLQIVNDRENHKVIDYLAARNELKRRSEQV